MNLTPAIAAVVPARPKRCYRCKVVKPALTSVFRRDRTRGDGLAAICIKCERPYHNAYRKEHGRAKDYARQKVRRAEQRAKAALKQ